MKKIIEKDNRGTDADKQDVHFTNDEESEIEIKCGPWHDTLEGAQKDEELFKKDKEAFLKLVKE